jgi:hypothetical protein
MGRPSIRQGQLGWSHLAQGDTSRQRAPTRSRYELLLTQNLTRTRRRRSTWASTGLSSLITVHITVNIFSLFASADLGLLGGRQIDGAIGSLDALEMIMHSQKVLDAQKSGKITVLFDSGVRTGSDIIKALAIGAQGVLSVSSTVLFVPIL